MRYPFHVRSGPDSWTDLKTRLRELDADRFMLVTEDGVPAGMIAQVQEHFQSVAPCEVLRFPASEKAKTVGTLDGLAEQALAGRATHRSVVVALGGGVAGNIGGLLAALLFRGIRLVHMPTTLLSMSDSVLSLKQGVNSCLGKNHLGTFYGPALVWNNLDFLATLPADEIRAALCEMIKNVLAICPELYDDVASRLRQDAVYDLEVIAKFIEVCVQAKTSVMHHDPFERCEALVLEYGHTVGHAAELLTDGRLRHGFAIGVGMLAAAHIAVEMGCLSRDEAAAHKELLTRNGAPTELPADLDVESVLEAVRLDNKRGYVHEQPGTCGFILLDGLGRPHLSDGHIITLVEEDTVRAAIATVQHVAENGR
jgi:3-dehydroquinate synthase/2-deoxy-scyllo-inosose synthase